MSPGGLCLNAQIGPRRDKHAIRADVLTYETVAQRNRTERGWGRERLFLRAGEEVLESLTSRAGLSTTVLHSSRRGCVL